MFVLFIKIYDKWIMRRNCWS